MWTRRVVVAIAILLGACTAFTQTVIPPTMPRPGGPAIPQPRANPRGPEDTPVGTARIRGQVLASDGQPLRRALVRVTAGEIRVTRAATTDAEGRFEVKDLPAGRYSVNASKGGFVSLDYGQRRPTEAGRSLQIGDGETLDRIEFRLPRGAVITGRIVDEYGDPVAGAQVQPLRERFFNGQRRLLPIGGFGTMAQSDDRGEYRLYGLASGEYVVSANVRNMSFGAESDDTTGYAPTYFPGTTNTGEAQRVSVLAGREHANVSFALSSARAVKITGTVVDSEGRPFANGSISVIQSISGPAVTMMFSSTGSRIRPDGSFTLSGVPPGSYTIQARGPGSGMEDGETAVLPLTVGSEDIVGVNLVATKGASITGTVTIDKASSGTVRPGLLQVQAEPDWFDVITPYRSARVDEGGGFRVTGLMGKRLFRLMTPPGWELKQVLLNGSDVTDTPIDFQGTDETSGLDLVITDRVTTVTGTVANAKGEPTRNYTVLVFPDDREKWAFRSRHVRTGRPDQQGRFEVRGLPPFEQYLAVAIDAIEEGQSSDPEFLESLRDRATKFSLGEGESHALSLKVVEMK